MDDDETRRQAAVQRGLLLLSAPDAPTDAINATADAIARRSGDSTPPTDAVSPAAALSDPRPPNDAGRNLVKASLARMNLARADLTRADLLGTNLADAEWVQVAAWMRWNQETWWPNRVIAAAILVSSEDMGSGIFRVRAGGSAPDRTGIPR